MRQNRFWLKLGILIAMLLAGLLAFFMPARTYTDRIAIEVPAEEVAGGVAAAVAESASAATVPLIMMLVIGIAIVAVAVTLVMNNNQRKRKHDDLFDAYEVNELAEVRLGDDGELYYEDEKPKRFEEM
jgi:1,4-dihydroxy-2-naphthoate octaprenyltransferase